MAGRTKSPNSAANRARYHLGEATLSLERALAAAAQIEMTPAVRQDLKREIQGPTEAIKKFKAVAGR